MGRRPCCAKEGINRGAWIAREDKVLTTYIQTHGEGKWRDLRRRVAEILITIITSQELRFQKVT
ncbi:hypothetical protein RJ640_004031 [Escallonia rubra]|uniref:Myb-like domain-containing protein n=1 Tax=Escallonia rubra TaxID=112253 RepID=A0AA88U971_9ASTE|nr:hypothetical protein RJ640_004031 [Escallonia rubra]